MMKKIYFFMTLIVIVTLCSVFYIFHTHSKISEDIALKNKVIENVKSSTEIDFSKVTNFDWDYMYVFTPYSIPSDIMKEDGVKYYNKNFHIEVLDTINMIGFVKSNRLIAFIDLPREYGGNDIVRPIIFNKDETRFNISKKNRTIIFEKK